MAGLKDGLGRHVTEVNHSHLVPFNIVRLESQVSCEVFKSKSSGLTAFDRVERLGTADNMGPFHGPHHHRNPPLLPSHIS